MPQRRTCENSVIWAELLGMPADVGFTASPEAFHKACVKMGVRDHEDFVEDGGDARCHHLVAAETPSRHCFIITIRRQCPGERPSIPEMGLVTHEAVHIWEKLMKGIGERRPLGEVGAYAIQFLSVFMGLCMEDAAGEKVP